MMQTFTIWFYTRTNMMEGIRMNEASKASVRSIVVLDKDNGYVVVFERVQQFIPPDAEV